MPSPQRKRLGIVDSIGATEPVFTSIASRERNDIQTFSITPSSNGFSGIVHLQGSVASPSDTDIKWFDVARIESYDERKTFSFDIRGEFLAFRMELKTGNLWSGFLGTGSGPVTAASTFDINGNAVTIPAGSDIDAVVSIINSDATLSAMNMSALNVDGFLFIRNTGGSPFTLSDVSGTGFSELGLVAGTYEPGKLEVEVLI